MEKLIGLLCLTSIIDIFTTPDSPSPKPNRIENVFSVLNKAQLSHVFPEIVKSHDDLSYAGTAFYLTHSYLVDSVNQEKYLNGLKLLSQIDEISNNSKGVIYYLIYKIRKSEGKTAEAEEYLQKSKNETSFIYQQLMEQDQYYDLQNLKNYISTKKIK